MPAAARVSDNHTCPLANPGGDPHVGGPIATGEPLVLIADLPAARVGDSATCSGPADTIVSGKMLVLIGDRPAATIGDQTGHGGVIVQGESTVLIGDSGAGAGGSTGATMRAARSEARPFCELCSEGQGDS